MNALPADFECIAGEEATSPFLAMSNYAQAAEPYYELAHWYGIARIQGQLEHVLIFPSSASGGPSAVICDAVGCCAGHGSTRFERCHSTRCERCHLHR
jgi:hypothetical protein